MRTSFQNALVLSILSLAVAACSKGGNLTLEPGARVEKSKGSSYVQVNQGGKSLIVEQGKTATTGVHGWVTVNDVSARSISSVNGTTAIINKSAAGR